LIACRARAARALPAFPTRRSSDLRTDRPSGEAGSKRMEHLAALMDQLGYDAHVAKDVDGAPAIEATHCIFHELALKRPQVCQFRSEEHTSELQSRENLVCRLLLEK